MAKEKKEKVVRRSIDMDAVVAAKYAKKNHNPVKIIFKVLFYLVLVLLLAAAGYIGYYSITAMNRIDDDRVLAVAGEPAVKMAELKKTYTIATQNIGFGAYSPNFTFFMDNGEKARAESEKMVRDNTKRFTDTIAEYNPDIVLVQEVDTKATRSWNVNQYELLQNTFSDCNSSFAQNAHFGYLLYPFNEPMGAVESGIATFSKISMPASTRISVPVSDGYKQFMDLDRCFTKSRIVVENGTDLVVYNVHFSAYGAEASVRSNQFSKLINDMTKEMEDGNFCIAGGDFNADFTGTSATDLNAAGVTKPEWAQPLAVTTLPQGITKVTNYSGKETVATCRNADIPLSEKSFLVILDGFIVSKDVEVVSVENVDTKFAYSDHNPVVMKFKLNGEEFSID